MRYKIICSLLFLCSLQPTIVAQQSTLLTLKTAISLVLKNSNQIKLNQAKIVEATLDIKEAEERKLPEANASASYMYLPFKPPLKLKIGNAGGNASPSVHHAMFASINGSMPLFTANKINYGIESAKYAQAALKLDAETDKSELILNAINGCINLFKAYEAVDLVEEDLVQSKQRLKDFSNLVKNGLLARNDLLKAELQTSNVELTLLDMESNYKMACVNMNIMMGLPEQTILVPDKSGLALPTTINSIEEYEQYALQNRNEFTSSDYRKKIAELGLKNVVANKYPTVALTAGYIAADIPKVLSVYNAINMGIGIKYNIANLWKNKTKIAQAESKIKQVQISQNMLSDNIRLQINQAYQNYVVSTKKIEVLEKSIKQAKENYRITKNKYNNSLATITEFLDADVALIQSKLMVANAKADSFLEYNKLLKAAGLLK